MTNTMTNTMTNPMINSMTNSSSILKLYNIHINILDLNTKLSHKMSLLDTSQNQLKRWLDSLKPSFQCYNFWMQEVQRYETLLNNINVRLDIAIKNGAQQDFITLNQIRMESVTKHVFVSQQLQNVTRLLQSHEPETYNLKMKFNDCRNNVKALKEKLNILTTQESNLLITLPLSDLKNIVDQSNTYENNRLKSELGPTPNCKDQKRALKMVLVKLLPPNINPNTSNINHLPSNLSINDLCLLIKLIGKLLHQRELIDRYWLERNKKANESKFVTYINSILTLKHAIAVNEDKRALLFLQNQLKIAWVRQ